MCTWGSKTLSMYTKYSPFSMVLLIFLAFSMISFLPNYSIMSLSKTEYEKPKQSSTAITLHLAACSPRSTQWGGVGSAAAWWPPCRRPRPCPPDSAPPPGTRAGCLGSGATLPWSSLFRHLHGTGQGRWRWCCFVWWLGTVIILL